MKNIIYGLCCILLAGNVLAKNTNTIQSTVLAKTSNSWDGQILPSYATGQPEITILKILIQPGAIINWHKHHFISAGVLLSGVLTVTTKDHKTLHLKAGDAIVEVVKTSHYGKNEGNEPAQIIVFYAGIQGKRLTSKE